MITAQDIENSPTFHKYCEAFREVAGIDVHLIDAISLEPDLLKVAQSLRFCNHPGDCHLTCQANRIKFADRLRSNGSHLPGPFAMRCFAGLTVIAIPIPLADETTAFLVTAPILLKGSGNTSPLKTVIQRIHAAGGQQSEKMIQSSFSNIPIQNRHHFKAAITLLRLFAQQISHMSRQMLAPSEDERNGKITVRRARELVDNRFTENIHLSEVAKRIGVSKSHLSHLFSRHVGLSFTEYLSTRRIMEMKRLLCDSDLTVTEIIFESGFQSVSQANRVFRANTGTSPRSFRLRNQP